MLKVGPYIYPNTAEGRAKAAMKAEALGNKPAAPAAPAAQTKAKKGKKP